MANGKISLSAPLSYCGTRLPASPIWFRIRASIQWRGMLQLQARHWVHATPRVIMLMPRLQQCVLTTIRRPFDCNFTALRPFDGLSGVFTAYIMLLIAVSYRRCGRNLRAKFNSVINSLSANHAYLKTLFINSLVIVAVVVIIVIIMIIIIIKFTCSFFHGSSSSGRNQWLGDYL